MSVTKRHRKFTIKIGPPMPGSPTAGLLTGTNVTETCFRIHLLKGRLINVLQGLWCIFSQQLSIVHVWQSLR